MKQILLDITQATFVAAVAAAGFFAALCKANEPAPKAPISL
jgi:hypothetical protein